MKSGTFAAIVAASVVVLAQTALADPIPVVAAENFYGDVASQIGGGAVTVSSILSNPDQDPHLFEASPSTARALVAAKLVIYNGVDYDPWMEKLLSANKEPGRKIIVVGDLMHRKSGANPHLWYDPATMPAAAKAIADELDVIDPAHKADYGRALAAFVESLRPFEEKVVAMRKKYAGAAVTATEPVAGYLAEAIGLKMRNKEFQLAVMNDAEPTAKQVAGFENDLKGHAVKALLYNNQATEELTKRMQALAQANRVPVVGVSETEPPNTTYQMWMMGQLDALDRALSGGAP